MIFDHFSEPLCFLVINVLLISILMFSNGTLHGLWFCFLNVLDISISGIDLGIEMMILGTQNDSL